MIESLFKQLLYLKKVKCTLVGKRIIHISQEFYRFTFRFLLHRHFFIFFEKYLFYLVSCYAKRMLYSGQPTVLLARRHLNTMLLTNFEFHFKHFPRKTRCLNFDGPSNYLHLFEKHRHFRDQGNVLHPTWKLLKCDFVQTFHTFGNPFLQIFAAGKASVVVALRLSLGWIDLSPM